MIRIRRSNARRGSLAAVAESRFDNAAVSSLILAYSAG
jgi:hypothetical protein